MTPIFLQLAQILQALLTPVIGIAIVYIAWQQWQANTRKLKLVKCTSSADGRI